MKRPSFSGTVGKKWWSWHLLSFWMPGGIGITIAESVLNGAAPYHDASVVVWIDAWGQGLEISGTNWPRSSNNDGVSWSSTCDVWKSSAVILQRICASYAFFTFWRPFSLLVTYISIIFIIFIFTKSFNFSKLSLIRYDNRNKLFLSISQFNTNFLHRNNFTNNA